MRRIFVYPALIRLLDDGLMQIERGHGACSSMLADVISGRIHCRLGETKLRNIYAGAALTALATILSAQQGLAQANQKEIAEPRSNEADKKPRAKASDDVFDLGRILVSTGEQAGSTSGQTISQSVVTRRTAIRWTTPCGRFRE